MATKYKGKDLSFLLATTELKLEGTEITLEPEDGDDDNSTFGELAAGDPTDWKLKIKAISDYGAGTLWNFLWTNAGGAPVAFVFKPYGNTTATTTKPHFKGSIEVRRKPGIGGEAGKTWTYEVELPVIGEPQMVTS